MTGDLKIIAKDYKENFDSNLIPFRIYKESTGDLKKQPLIKSYSHWLNDRQSIEEIDKINWNSTTNGIGLILGVSNWGCIDIDHSRDEGLLNDLLNHLGLNKDYEWIVTTPRGYHVYFKYDDLIFDFLGDHKAKYDYKLKNKNYKCDHIELRLKNCVSVVPPSKLSDEIKYSFKNIAEGIPSNSPDNIETQKIKTLVSEFFITEKQKTSSNKSTIKNLFDKKIDQGKRHDSLIKLAGMYKSHRFNEAFTISALLGWNKSNVNPPLPESEVIAQVRDIFRRYDSVKPIELTNAREIQEMILKPINWIIEDFLCEGLTILAGRPKIGKSWLVLLMSFAVATGGLALGKFRSNKHSVLYIPYEDNARRLQDRMNNLLSAEHLTKAPDNLFYPKDCNFPKLNQSGLETLESILDKDESIKLVVIDTLGRAIERNNKRNSNLFQDEYDFGSKLQKIAMQRNIGIIIVHHTSKLKYEDVFDQVLGTTGLTAAPDSIMMLYKDGDSYKISLRGKDIQENDYEMKFDNCIWTVTEERQQLSPEQARIMDLLDESEKELSTSQIAKILNTTNASASNMLKKLTKQGLIKNPSYGKYICIK